MHIDGVTLFSMLPECKVSTMGRKEHKRPQRNSEADVLVGGK